MHNSPPQPPSYNLNPSARDTSEEYRPPIHKTTIYLPTQTPPCPSLVPPAPCDGKSPAIYLPLPIFSFHESSLPGPDGSCTRGGVCVCVCAAALVLCNHTIETTKARRASSQCQHGSETVSHTHTQTHGQI